MIPNMAIEALAHKDWAFRELSENLQALKVGDTCSEQKGIIIINHGYMSVSGISVRIDQHLPGMPHPQIVVLGMDETKLLKRALRG